MVSTSWLIIVFDFTTLFASNGMWSAHTGTDDEESSIQVLYNN